ncbi:MAG: Hsp70 family protein [Bacteriovoracaceae bacterium]|nr:Hsp70 family protein [Bacteriovoracaceae bacterium]
MATKIAYGIDLGTTNSCISRWSGKQFEIIQIDGAKTIPSVIAHDGKGWLVGQSALDYSKLDPSSAISSVKRHIGDKDFNCEVRGMKLTPTEVSAKILEYIKLKAQEATNEVIQDVVITVPAYFNDTQRRATVAAGKLAGFNVSRIINEPTAASLVYEMGKTSNDVDHAAWAAQEDELWMVYDLGGGTFDVSILSAKEGIKEVLSSTGNNYLGGDDFDKKIVNWLVDQIHDLRGVDVSDHEIALAKLKHLAEEAKITLTYEAKAEIIDVLDLGGRKVNVNFVLGRRKLEEMIIEDVNSTIEKTRQALKDSNCSAGEIKKLILVGGSTRIPLISRRLKEEFDLLGQHYIDPDLSISLGASVQSAITAGLNFESIVIDVAPHSLGIAAVGALDMGVYDYADVDDYEYGQQAHVWEQDESLDQAQKRHPKTFATVIGRNSKLPAKFVETFSTMVPGQENVEVAVYQGESPCTKDNLFIGSFNVQLESAPVGTPIHIGMEYDLNGVIKIDVAHGEDLQYIKSHKMNLYQSALMNTDTDAISLNLDTPGQEDGSLDQLMAPAHKVMNLLVQRVENALGESSSRAEKMAVQKLLDSYTQALEDEEDDQLDSLEDNLYDWLDTKGPQIQGQEMTD